jgi:hypothetical protein
LKLPRPRTDGRAIHRASEGNSEAAAMHSGGESIPSKLPMLLALPEDTRMLSPHQCFLPHQVEAFEASEEDVSTHTRGQNKPVTLGQGLTVNKSIHQLSVVTGYFLIANFRPFKIYL